MSPSEKQGQGGILIRPILPSDTAAIYAITLVDPTNTLTNHETQPGSPSNQLQIVKVEPIEVIIRPLDQDDLYHVP
jgi:hypothetical protein